MTYLSASSTERTAIYYSYSDLLRDPLGLSAAGPICSLVGKEVKQLEPALISARPAPKVEVQIDGPARDAVEWMARADDAGASLHPFSPTGSGRSRPPRRVGVPPWRPGAAPGPSRHAHPPRGERCAHAYRLAGADGRSDGNPQARESPGPLRLRQARNHARARRKRTPPRPRLLKQASGRSMAAP